MSSNDAPFDSKGPNEESLELDIEKKDYAKDESSTGKSTMFRGKNEPAGSYRGSVTDKKLEPPTFGVSLRRGWRLFKASFGDLVTVGLMWTAVLALCGYLIDRTAPVVSNEHLPLLADFISELFERMGRYYSTFNSSHLTFNRAAFSGWSRTTFIVFGAGIYGGSFIVQVLGASFFPVLKARFFEGDSARRSLLYGRAFASIFQVSITVVLWWLYIGGAILIGGLVPVGVGMIGLPSILGIIGVVAGHVFALVGYGASLAGLYLAAVPDSRIDGPLVGGWEWFEEYWRQVVGIWLITWAISMVFWVFGMIGIEQFGNQLLFLVVSHAVVLMFGASLFAGLFASIEANEKPNKVPSSLVESKK